MRNYLESILKSITNLVVTLNDDGRMVTANHPVEPFLGVNEHQLVETSYESWFAGANAEFVADIRRVLEPDSKPIYVADYELRHDDKTISLNYNIVPLLDFGEAQKGAVLVLENISQQKRVMGTLTRHLGPGVAQQLLEGAENRLGGVRQEVTILFSDIRGYTSLTESMDAGEIVAMLNDYFSLMIDEIFAEDGVLDKYIGDALMAVFGVPFPSPTDAIHACRCALRMMKALDVFNNKLKQNQRPPIAIGIGINSGEVITGNIGSEKRLEYTCIGDAVNLASRLEGACKTYGVSIILQETTQQVIGQEFLVRELDLIRVKGKKHPSRIYELLGSKSHPISPLVCDALPHFDAGLNAYRNRDFSAAKTLFETSYSIGGDRPSRLFLDRCQILLEQPPGSDWDGVWKMTSK
jgi:adenylate cyclase